MQSGPLKGQDQYIETVRNSVAKHLAAERRALASLIDEQLTEIHKSLLNHMEEDLRETVPSTLLPNSGESGGKVDSENILTEGTEQDVSLALSADSSEVPFKLNKSERMVERHRGKNVLTRLVGSPAFEGFFIGAILLNTLVSALEAQYRSFDIGERIQYRRVSTGPDTWSFGKDLFPLLEYSFATLYTLEIVMKLAALRCDFWRSRWNVFDFTLVAFWYVNELFSLSKVLNPTILRLCRLARLVRVLQHVGWFESLDSLHMLVTAMASSFSVLIWSVLLLMSLLAISALLTNAFLLEYLEDPTKNPAMQRDVYKFFGSFSRSFISMFEMAFHSHAPITRTIMEEVDERWAIYFLTYKCIVGLSVMKVITGVFLHETFKVCAEDDELMIIQKKRAVQTHTRKMEKLFANLNDDGSPTLTMDEFEDVMKDDWVHTWLNAMGLDTSNAARLWCLLDTSEDGELTAEELVKGVSKLKGAATSLDMNHVVHALGKLRGQIDKMNTQLVEYDEIILQHSLPAAVMQCGDSAAQPSCSKAAKMMQPLSQKPKSIKADEAIECTM